MSEQPKMEDFSDLLLEGAERMGLSVQGDLVEKLALHWEELRLWSGRMNLTSLHSPKEAAEKLYLESLFAASLLDGPGDVHDVGSGAGFPGLVLKAARPGLRVLLTEAREKKVFFLRQVARRMRMEDGLEIVHGRIGWEAPVRRATEVFSRAAFPPKIWLSLAPALVEPGGRFWLFASFSGASNGDARIDTVKLERVLTAGVAIEEVHGYRLPFCGAVRQLISFRCLGLAAGEEKKLAKTADVC